VSAFRGVKLSPDIDPFRRRQVPDVAGRFREAQDRQKQHADLMWAGTLTSLFSDHELRLLDELGNLCPHDRDLISRAGRNPWRRRPAPPRPDAAPPLGEPA
jgi:hypothetical protein